MYLPRFTILFLFHVLILSSGAYSQSNEIKKIALLPHYGFVLKNKLETAHLSNQHPWGAELEYLIQTTGRKSWQTEYNNPSYGLSLQYWQFDPDKRLGNQLGIVMFFKGKLLQRSDFAITYRIAGGGGLVGKRFDLHTNTQNNLLSSRLNFVLNGRVAYEQKFSSGFSTQIGIDLLHFSNGSVRMPNGGINIPNIFAGLQYTLSQPSAPVQAEKAPKEKRWLLLLAAAAGSKNEYPVNSRNHPVGTLSAYGGRQLNNKSTLIAGADLFYDGTKRYWVDDETTVNVFQLLQGGLVAGHELSIHNLAIITHLGYSFYQPVSINPRIYQRYGIRYYLLPGLAVNAAMRAHLGKADFVEWGLTYRIINK